MLCIADARASLLCLLLLVVSCNSTPERSPQRFEASQLDLAESHSFQYRPRQQQGPAARRRLQARITRINPYGARYSTRSSELLALPHRELAEGTLQRRESPKERRRRERRKALNRKAKQQWQGSSIDGSLQTLRSSDLELSKPRFAEPIDQHAKPAGFDSRAVEEQVSASTAGGLKAVLQAPPGKGGSQNAVVRKGQGGLEWKEAGGIDSSGVSEHLHDLQEDPSLLDASGHQRPKQSQAAGVDSAGVSGHIAEDVGQDLLDKSGASLDFLRMHPRDASDREVVSEVGASEVVNFDQQAISEAAQDGVARTEEKGETETSSAGVMPSDWAAGSASPSVDNAADLLEVFEKAA